MWRKFEVFPPTPRQEDPLPLQEPRLPRQLYSSWRREPADPRPPQHNFYDLIYPLHYKGGLNSIKSLSLDPLTSYYEPPIHYP